MPAHLPRYVAILFLLCGCSPFARTQGPKKPLAGDELLALVAGEALSENIVHDIESRGLAFIPSEAYRSEITTAGADARVLAALKTARVSESPVGAGNKQDTEMLHHLAVAGKLIRAKQYDQAAEELDAALQSTTDPAPSFVLGELVSRQDQWRKAVSVYSDVLDTDANFPEAHTKLAYSFHRVGRPEDTLQEVKIALADNPDDAEAHRVKGIALDDEHKYDAAMAEYREALRIKPDYGLVHYDMGVSFGERQDRPNAIVEYRKSIALDPQFCCAHYNLANILSDNGDIDGAILEYREAKRVNPTRLDVRQNLAVDLSRRNRPAAIQEFRELIAMSPDFAYAHTGLGSTLLEDGDYNGAEAEFRISAKLDPSDADVFAKVGHALELQGRYAEAIPQYVQAVRLDPRFARAHLGLGRTYLQQQNYAESVRELTQSTNLEPEQSEDHDLLAQALSKIGNVDGAIAEDKEALLLAPQNSQLMSRLAGLLEKKGDRSGALEQYRLAADVQRDQETRDAYAAAQHRLGGEPKATTPAQHHGDPASAEPPSPSAAAAGGGKDLESRWRDAMEVGDRALREGRYADAQTSLKSAVALAENLKPRDERLLNAVAHLAFAYVLHRDWAQGKIALHRQLTLAREISGPQSSQTVPPLEGLAGVALEEKDYATAEKFYLQAIERTENILGLAHTMVAVDLVRLAAVYEAQGAFAKAEPLVLRANSISEAISSEGPVAESYLQQVATLYIKWEKFDKAEPYCRKVLALREKQYGANSHMVVAALQTLTDVLTKLGRAEEAANLRNRTQAILASDAR
jgi:tetratricopeptide (TPR) repeat protein